LRGEKNGTQRVSSRRRLPSFIANIAIAAAIVLGIGAATVTTGTRASSPDSTAGIWSAPSQAPTSLTSYEAETVEVNGASTDPNGMRISIAHDPTVGGTTTRIGRPPFTTRQETSASVAYRGSWSRAVHPDYIGGSAFSSNQRGASARLTFTGPNIAWIGPVGPTRGKARIYVDGRYVKTIDTYSPRFSPSRVLYSAAYATERRRTFAIVVLGTKGHPTVAIDALVVRSNQGLVATSPASETPVASPTPAATQSTIPTGTPAPSATLAPSPTPTPTPVVSGDVTPASIPGITGVYGPAINADNLNNSPIGGPQNQQTAYRFRATQTSALNSIRIYIVDNTHPGYGGGTGGTMRITVQTDDGTANHAPSSTILATTDVVHPVDGAGNVYAFAAPAQLVAGQLYHIVFRNIDPSPTVNFVSVDGLFVYADLPVWQPAFPNTDWANLVKLGGGSWSADRGAGQGTITPIMALNYANGVVGGVGYMEIWYRDPKTISGSGWARERFTVSGPSRQVSSVSVRLKRVSGSSPLIVRLETSSGDLVEQGSIPASSITTTGQASWATYRFATSRTLVAGQTYHLVLSSTSDTSYSIFVIRKGVAYGFSQVYFADGSAQYNPGTGWVAFDPGWRGPLDEGDLQLYFR
jgi:hypothetical protein